MVASAIGTILFMQVPGSVLSMEATGAGTMAGLKVAGAAAMAGTTVAAMAGSVVVPA